MPSDLQPDLQLCKQALSELLVVRQSVTAALLAYRDGRPLAFRSKDSLGQEKLAAMASSLVVLSQSILTAAAADVLELALLEGRNYKLLFLQVPTGGDPLVLALRADSSESLGRVLSDAKICASRVSASFAATATTAKASRIQAPRP